MSNEKPPAVPRYPRRAGEARRRALLQTVRAMQERGHAPTYAELAAALGVSVPTVRYHLTWLAEHGVIRLGPPRLNIEIVRADAE